MILRRAHCTELAQIVSLLVDDEIAHDREGNARDLAPYLAAWEDMEAATGNWTLVAVEGDEVVGMLQLTVIAGLSRRGTTRGQIEGVRVKASARGQSVGKRLVQYAIDTAKEAGCGLVQLTTDKRRTDAKRFYESLGFTASHEGMKAIL